MHKPAFSHLKLQDIIFIIQHGQMNILLNTFPIAIVRQLDIGTISGDYGIFAGNKSEIDDTPVIAQYLECVTGLQSTGNIRNFGYIVTQLLDTFQIRWFETRLLLRCRSCYRQQHCCQHGNEILLLHVRIYWVNVLASDCHKYKYLF